MKKKEIPLLALFFILPIFFLSGTLTSNKTFFMRDLTYLFHPWRNLSSQMIQGGEMPLWNSFEMGGMPFLANCQSAILYPFTIFFSSYSFVTALKLFHYFHYLLCGFGFYILGRKMEFHRFAALGGAILFTYNGYLLTRLEFLSVLGSAIWMPWIMCFIVRSESAPLPTAVLTALGLSLSLLAGFPQIVILQIVACVIFLVFTNRSLKRIFIFAGSMMLFILICSMQWLPTKELLTQSIRAGGSIPFNEAASYSLPFDSIFGLVYPFRILHHPDRFTGEKFFWIWSAWCGFASLFPILLSVLYKEKKIFFYGLILASFGLVWSMGSQFEWFKIFFRFVPIIRMFRFPPVALYWTVFSLSILLMCGLAVCSRIEIPWVKTKTMLAASVTLILTIELWHYSRELLPTIIPEYFTITSQGIATVIKNSPGTVMLSPKLNQQRRLAGMTTLDATLRFRAYFFDLTNLPYRIKTLIPSGEPLALKSFENIYGKFTHLPSINDAKKLMDLMNVTHFLTSEILTGNWKLVDVDRDLKVYANNFAKGAVFALENHGAASDIHIANRFLPEKTTHQTNKVSAIFNNPKELIVLFDVPYYPGWKIFCANCTIHGGQPLRSITMNDYFHGTKLPAGRHQLYLVYTFASWKTGILISSAALLLICFIALKKTILFSKKCEAPRFISF